MEYSFSVTLATLGYTLCRQPEGMSMMKPLEYRKCLSQAQWYMLVEQLHWTKDTFCSCQVYTYHVLSTRKGNTHLVHVQYILHYKSFN